jgi:biopolymer transport protein ExbB/TolQ
MQDLTLVEYFQKGGIVFIILILCSIVSLKVIIEKLFAFQAFREKQIKKFNIELNSLMQTGSVNDVYNLCKFYKVKIMGFKISMPFTETIIALLQNSKKSREELNDLAGKKIDETALALEERLGILSTIGAIAPFIGLFGTVVGIIKAFHGLGVSDSMAAARVADGIAEALINTAAGLLVAVPAVMFYNYFMRQLKKALIYMDNITSDIINNIHKG